jgi:NitT/TauT family transport system substrate-binding protein
VEQQGHFTPKVFLLADYGYPGYANMVLVPQKWIDANPKAVQAFYDASRDGWYDYLNGNPASANALIKRDNPEQTDDRIAYAIKVLNERGIATSGDALTGGIGAMSDKRWAEFYQSMVEVEVFSKGLDVRQAYTLDFVNKGIGKPA